MVPGYVQLPRPGGSDPWRSASSPEANGILAGTPPIGFLVSPIAADSFRDNTFWNISAELNGTSVLRRSPCCRRIAT